MANRVKQLGVGDPREDLVVTGTPEQESLFGRDETPFDWEIEWQGMPEFRMGNIEPVQKITVSFKTWEDAKEFGKIIDQTITGRTDSLWFPKIENYTAPKNYRYVDES